MRRSSSESLPFTFRPQNCTRATRLPFSTGTSREAPRTTKKRFVFPENPGEQQTVVGSLVDCIKLIGLPVELGYVPNF